MRPGAWPHRAAARGAREAPARRAAGPVSLGTPLAHLCGQAIDEGAGRHILLRVPAHVANPNHAVTAFEVAFADDHDVRNALELRIAHASLHALTVALIDGGAKPTLPHARSQGSDVRH